MAVDFDKWLENDPSSKLTRTASRVTVTAGNSAMFFSSGLQPSARQSLNVDRDHTFAFQVDNIVGAGGSVTLYNMLKTSSPAASLKLIAFEGGGVKVKIEETYAGLTFASSTYAISLATTYYCKRSLVRTGATFGTFTVRIYSDAGMTNLLATLSLDLHGIALYSELRALEDPSGTVTAWLENLDLGTPSVIASTSFDPIIWDPEDISLYSETDPESKISVDLGAKRITAESGLNYGRVSVLKGVQYITGNRVRGKVTFTGNEGAGSRTTIFGVSNTDGPVLSWANGLHLDAYYDGANYQLKVADVVTEFEDTSTNLSASSYYWEFRRSGRWVYLYIFSDEYVTLIDTLLIHGIKDDDSYAYVYGITTMLADANEPTWDLLSQQWPDATGWTPAGTGTIEINPAGQAHSLPSASQVTRYQKNIGAIPSQYVIKTRQYYDALGNQASGNRVRTTYRNGENQVILEAFTDKVGVGDTYNAIPNNLVALTTNTATWYEWWLITDSANNRVKVFRKADAGDWVYIGTQYGLYVDTGNDGLIYTAYAVRGASGNCELHEDYIQIASGIHYPPCPEYIRNVQCSIENLTIDRVEFDKVMAPEYAITATVEHNGESLPGTGWASDIPAGTVLELTQVWAASGTSSIRFVGKSDGTADASLTKSFTAATNPIGEGLWKVKVISIADGQVCHFGGKVKSSNGYKAVAAATRVGSKYYWCILYYNGTWNKVTSAHELNLNQAYLIDLCLNDDANNPAQDALSLVVDGVIVADIQATTTLGNPFLVDTAIIGYCGGAATFPCNAERYIDSFRYRKNSILRFGGLAIASNGDLVAAATDAAIHYPDTNAPVYLMTSSDLGDSFVLEQTIDTASKEDHPNGLVSAGNNLYYFNSRMPYSTPGQPQYYTDVWKATNNAFPMTKVYDSATQTPSGWFNASKIVESGKILSAYIFTPPDPAVAGEYVKFCPFDTATDTFASLPVNKIADITDYFNCIPNETNMFRRPSDDAIVAFVRGDEHTGGVDTLFQKATVSTDDGVSFGSAKNLSLLWGNKGGKIHSAVINGSLWLCGYHIADMDNYSASMQTFIMQVDPNTLMPIQEKRWTFVSKGQELGNGELVASAVDPSTGGFYLYLLVHSGASLYFYRFLVGKVLPPGGERILRGVGRGIFRGGR